jgi:hypothetical protein
VSDDGLCYSANNLATLDDLFVTDLSHNNSTSIQELRQAFGQSVALAQHLLRNLELKATTIVVDCDHLRQQHVQEGILQQIVQNLVSQCEAEIQLLQTWNQETTAESNAYQDRITTLQNELNRERANTGVLQAAAVAAGITSEQQPHVQPASIPNLEKCDSGRKKL